MKYKKYKVEDFLADKNFINWVTNPSAESEKYWQGVLQSHPEKKQEMLQAAKLLKSIHFRKIVSSNEQKERILTNTISLTYSDRSKSISSSRKKTGGIKFLQLAAIIIIFTSAAVFLTFQFLIENKWASSSSSEAIEMMTKQNPAGRKSRFYLPDGSYVTLNAESKIDYYSNFAEKRELWLSGEASFEVKENPESNFLVHTDRLDIVVTGTTFNVSAFPNEQLESISLLSGKVNVACGIDSLNETYDLIPGEKLSVDLTSNSSSISDLNMDEVLWSSGILVFDNDDIETFSKKIHRWYGVTTVVSGTPQVKININGKFDNESLINVLEGLRFSLGMDYNFDNNVVNLQF